MAEVRVRLAFEPGAFVSGINQAEGSLGRFEARGQGVSTAVDRSSGSVARLTSGLVALAGVATIGQLVQQAVSLADEFSNMTGRLALVTESTAQATGVQRELFQVAQDTRQSVSGLSELYVKLSKSTESLGLDQSRLIGLVRTVGQTLTLSAGEAASMQAALMQLGQGMSSGTLRGEELNSVIEQTPALAEAIARGMGRTTGQLRELGAEGKITAEQIVRALESSAGAVENDFSKLPLTVGQAMTQVRNALLQSVGVMDQTSGISRGLAQAVSGLARNMDLVVAAAGALASVVAGRLVVAMVAGVQSLVAKRAAHLADLVAIEQSTAATVRHTAAQLADAQASLARQAGFGGVAAAQAVVTTATVQHTAALASHAAAQSAAAAASSVAARVLGVLGGPIGAVVTGLGLAVSAWAAWSAAAKSDAGAVAAETQRSTADVVASLDKQIAKLKERNRLREESPQAAAGGDQAALDALAEVRARIGRGMRREGEFAAMNDTARNLALIEASREYSRLESRIRAVAELEAGGRDAAQSSERSKWLTTYATDAQKLQIELAKAREAFGGVIPPGLELAIREKFAKPAQGAAEAARGYADVMTDLARIEAEAQGSAGRLSQAQQRLAQYLASPVYAQHTDTVRQQVVVQAAAAVEAERLAAAQSAAEAASAEALRTTGELVRRDLDAVDAIAAQVKATRLQTEEIGLTTEALRKLEIQRIREAEAQAVQQLQQALAGRANVEEVAAITQRVEALRELAQAKTEAANKQDAEDRRKSLEADAKAAGEAYAKQADTIERSVRDALQRAFADSEGFAKGFSKVLSSSIKTELSNAVLTPLSKALSGSIQQLIKGAGGSASGASGGISANTLGDLWSAFKSGGNQLSTTVSLLAEDVGAWLVTNTSGALNQLGGSVLQNSLAIGNVAPYIGSITQALQGDLKGAALSAAGMFIGNMLLPGVGGILGSIAGNFLGGLFGGKKEPPYTGGAYVATADGDGYRPGINGSDASFLRQTNASLADFTKRRNAGLDEAIKPLALSLGAAYNGILSNFGKEAGDVALSFRTRGKNGRGSLQVGDEVMFASRKWGGSAQEAFNSFASAAAGGIVDALRKAGLPDWAQSVLDAVDSSKGTEALQAAATTIGQVIDVTRKLAMVPSFAGITQAETFRLAQLAGGLDGLQASVSSFIEATYTDAERLQIGRSSLADQIAALAVPESLGTVLRDRLDNMAQTLRDGGTVSLADYRGLVEGLDGTDEAQASLQVGLLRLASAFAEVNKSTAGAAQTIEAEVRRLRGLDGSADVAADRSTALARFTLATAQARAGDAEALQSLPGLARAAEDAAALLVGSAADMARMRAWLASSLEQTIGTRPAAGAVPAFAAGGVHTGGWRLVGEQGPEIEYTGPSRIFSAADTRRLLQAEPRAQAATPGSSAQDELMGRIQAEIAGMRRDMMLALGQVATQTAASAEILRRASPTKGALTVVVKP